MSKEDALLYSRFVKPELGRLFSALRLDVVYERGSGDLLTWRDETGREHEVLDCLGGYGASLFGHNHPALVETLCRALQSGQVFNGQKSCRAGAARTAARLSELLGRFTGQSYIATFTNSGAEAVEAALKHATMAYRERAERDRRGLSRATAKLVERWRRDQIRVAPDLLTEARACFPSIGTSGDVSLIADQVLRAATAVFAREPLFVALNRAFHGLTTGAVQITAGARYRDPFEGLGVNAAHLQDASEEALRSVIEASSITIRELAVIDGELRLTQRRCSRVAALFVEPLQGEGGIRPLSPDFLQAARRLADAWSFPLVCDEIQSGMGRTGTFLYSEQVGLRPDYVLLGKSLGGGLTKLGCLLVDRRLYCDEFSVAHSSTFAEDDLSASVAVAALDLLESDQLLVRCRETGAFTKRELSELAERYPQVIEEIRGEGLMLGIGLRDFRYSPSLPLQMLAQQEMLGYLISGYLLHEHGVRVGPTLSHAGTIRIEPSAYITRTQVRHLVTALSDLCRRLQNGDVNALIAYLLPSARGRLRPPAPVEVLCTAPVDPRAPWADTLPRCDPALDQLPQVAFLAHFASAEDIPDWEPSLAHISNGDREALLDRIHDVLEPMVHDRSIIYSTTGHAVCMNVIGLCVDARLMSQYVRGRDRRIVLRHLELAVEQAELLGCSVVGLGGYTSIVAGNGLLLKNNRAALTTGNALTVGMGLAAIQRSAATLGMSLAGGHFAAIGAGGNIASIYSEVISQHVATIHLIGRAESLTRVEETAGRVLRAACEAARKHLHGLSDAPTGVAARLLDGPARALLQTDVVKLEDAAVFRAFAKEMGSRCPVTVGSDLAAVRHANLVLSASNAPKHIVLPEMLGDQPTIICDISVPPDADPRIEQLRPNAMVIQGGVVRMPKNPDFHPPGSPLPPGRCYACLAETVLLGLEGITENFSYGMITRERVELASGFAQKHGFVLAEADLQKRGYNEFSRHLVGQVA